MVSFSSPPPAPKPNSSDATLALLVISAPLCARLRSPAAVGTYDAPCPRSDRCRPPAARNAEARCFERLAPARWAPAGRAPAGRAEIGVASAAIERPQPVGLLPHGLRRPAAAARATGRPKEWGRAW